METARTRQVEVAEAARARRIATLLRRIKARLPELDELLESTDDVEDLVYRFYHQSFKVYFAQDHTRRVVAALGRLLPGVPINEWFAQITAEGTGRRFTSSDNERWLEVTRPQLEAFFHARYFLQQVCRYGRELDEPPEVMPFGWAAVLYLYGLR